MAKRGPLGSGDFDENGENLPAMVKMANRAKNRLRAEMKSATQIWVVTRHQYGISALVPQTLFRGNTSGGVAKCRMFSQASHYLDPDSASDWLKRSLNQ